MAMLGAALCSTFRRPLRTAARRAADFAAAQETALGELMPRLLKRVPKPLVVDPGVSVRSLRPRRPRTLRRTEERAGRRRARSPHAGRITHG